MQTSNLSLARVSLIGGIFGLALGAVAGASCGGNGTTPPPSQCPPDPDAAGTQMDGQCCQFSINCQAGRICNTSSEELFDATKMPNICVKVICTTDGDCESPKKCTLSKICGVSACQADSECSPGQLCLAGKCGAAPSAQDAASCVIVTRDGSIRQGATLKLEAVAKNANGAVLPKIEFDWSSSNAQAVAVAGSTATGGTMGGASNIGATVKGKASVVCTNGRGTGNNISLTNFADVPQGMARVVIVADDDGSPVQGADITVIAGANPSNQMSGADGSAMFAVAAAPTSVTAIKAGFQMVSVVSPGSSDIFIPLPRIANKTKAGGFRGSIDISKTKKADIQLGIAGPSLPPNILDFEFTSLIGDSVPTVIDAPDLGLNMQNVNLPGGVMLALGSKKFTDDSGSSGGGVRCQGQAPASTELGCYVARAPAGPSAAWVLAGQLKLTAVSKIAGKISGAIGDDNADLPIGDILTAVLPLLRKLNHGVNAGLVIREFDKVNKTGQQGNCADPSLAMYDDKCQGDFSKYEKITLAADQELSLLSAVTIPTLPRLPDNKYMAGAVLISGSLVPGRGLVPLGLSAGLDVLATEAPDGRVAGIDKPFGDTSPKLPDGQLALSMASPHGGIEGSPLVFFVIAIDPNSIAADDGSLQLSGIVKRVNRIDPQMTVDGDFLPLPTGTLDVAMAKFTPSGTAIGAAKMTRLELQRGGNTWLIYTPGNGTPIDLPDVAAARQAVLGQGMEAFVQVVEAAANDTQYADVFRFGSGKNLDRAVDLIGRLSVNECKTAATASCKIQ